MIDHFAGIDQAGKDKILHTLRSRIRKGLHWEGKIIEDMAIEYVLPPEAMAEYGQRIYTKYSNEFDSINGAALRKIEAFLSDKYSFKRNAITKRVLYRPIDKPEEIYEPCRYNDIWRDLQHNLKEFGKRAKIPISDVQTLLESDYVEEFNPIKEYFERRNKWDGTDYIAHLASFIHTTDQDFWIEQFKKCLVRMIACSYHQVVNRTVMVLVQPAQEAGKCLGKGTRVMMADFSIKNVEDIRIGDQVMGPDGKPRNVLETHSGIDQMYWVRQSKGIDYRVNSNHILSLKKRKHRQWEGRIVNIHLNQYLATTKNYQFELMGWKPQFDFPEKQAKVKTKRPRPATLTGIKIEKDTVDEYYGFSTDGDHLFLLEDFTVTHNSNFLQFLCPIALKEYYKEDPITTTKDSEIAMTENFIWNMEELEALDRKEINSLKAFISRGTSKQRRAYARFEESRPRIVNFWGSTNKEQFLTDTQNSRWLCFRVNHIDWDYNNYKTGVRKVDIDKVWDQAWQLYKDGFNYSLDKDEALKRDRINHSFESMGNEKQLIIKYLTKIPANSVSGEFNMVIDIVQYLQAATLYKIQIHAFNVQTAMMQLGFISEERAINGNKVKGFWVMKKALMNGQTLPIVSEAVPDENNLPF